MAGRRPKALATNTPDDRKMIRVEWMNQRPPTVAQWKQKSREVDVAEALTAKLQLLSLGGGGNL